MEQLERLHEFSELIVKLVLHQAGGMKDFWLGHPNYIILLCLSLGLRRNSFGHLLATSQSDRLDMYVWVGFYVAWKASLGLLDEVHAIISLNSELMLVGFSRWPKCLGIGHHDSEGELSWLKGTWSPSLPDLIFFPDGN